MARLLTQSKLPLFISQRSLRHYFQIQHWRVVRDSSASPGDTLGTLWVCFPPALTPRLPTYVSIAALVDRYIASFVGTIKVYSNKKTLACQQAARLVSTIREEIESQRPAIESWDDQLNTHYATHTHTHNGNNRRFATIL